MINAGHGGCFVNGAPMPENGALMYIVGGPKRYFGSEINTMTYVE